MIKTSESKKMLFRLKPEMKRDFALALAKNEIGAQHALEAFVERVISFDQDRPMYYADKKTVESVLKRAKILQSEARAPCA